MSGTGSAPVWPLVEIPHARSETASRYRFDDGIGEIGIIVPHPFCGWCSRIRITSDGKMRTCLFSLWDHDLHELMRRGANAEELVEFLWSVVEKNFPSPVTSRPITPTQFAPTIWCRWVSSWDWEGSGSTRSATHTVRGWTKPERPWACSRS